VAERLAKAGSKRRAEQEVKRLEQMLANRKARVADAERKLTAARERLKAPK
jgi:hypothetical protein